MEPVIPIDLLNNDLINIKDKGNGYAMFLYSNSMLGEFEMKILVERVKLVYNEQYNCLYLKSDDLKLLEKFLEKKIQEYKGGELVKRDERSKKIKISITSKSNLTIIRNKHMEKYNSKTKIKDIVEIKNFFETNQIWYALTNIVIKPVISTKSNFVRFEIIYGDIFKEFLTNTGQIYNKLETLKENNLREKIIL
jgi:hypothetical protein